MKYVLFALLFFSVPGAIGQTKIIQIDSRKFIIKTILKETDYTDEPIREIEVYKNGKKILTHTLREVWGDCNSEVLQFGTHEKTDTSITFYSYWAWAGDAPVSPFGGRKQVYKVGANGNLTLMQSELYVETSRQGWKENKGIEYLFTPPKNATQRKLLLEYIKEVEKMYNAHFVFGAKSDALLKEVRAKFSSQIAAETKYWGESGPHKTFGYKK